MTEHKAENTAPADATGIPAETMEDYAAELEASFKKVKEGDILTGTVVGVTDTQVLLDLKYYAEGVIDKENLSNDPDFNMKEEIHPGDEITATVLRLDDGEGNLVLSRKEANDRMAWERLREMLEARTIVPVKVSGVVNGGVIAKLEGVRGFIPASRLDASYVEDLNEWLGKTVEATVITADGAAGAFRQGGGQGEGPCGKESAHRQMRGWRGDGWDRGDDQAIRRVYQPGKRTVRPGPCFTDQQEPDQASGRGSERGAARDCEDYFHGES